MHLLCIYLCLIPVSNPYKVAEPNPYAVQVPQAPALKPPNVPDDFYVHWLDSNTFSLPSKLAGIQGELGSKAEIYAPINGEWKRYATLSNPTIEQITTSLEAAHKSWKAEKAVSLKASPKSWPLPNALHDDDLSGAGPLPDGYVLPDGMKRYKRASMTQEIAVTDGRDRITPRSRISLHARDARWLVSGGLLGFDFRSDLYRNNTAATAREYVDNIDVWNGRNYQQNRGWRREFPDGSKFLDVLSNTAGKVFEIRQREKAEGRWNSEVIYENESARPEGYSGLTKSCVSCHNAKDGAGTGPYAGPLVLGSDTVFSVPFAALER